MVAGVVLVVVVGRRVVDTGRAVVGAKVRSSPNTSATVDVDGGSDGVGNLELGCVSFLVRSGVLVTGRASMPLNRSAGSNNDKLKAQDGQTKPAAGLAEERLDPTCYIYSPE